MWLLWGPVLVGPIPFATCWLKSVQNSLYLNDLYSQQIWDGELIKDYGKNVKGEALTGHCGLSGKTWAHFDL